MFNKNRRLHTRAARQTLTACALAFTAAACLAQSSSSSSSQNGTTAAPGTAPLQSRTVAQQIAPERTATYDEKIEFFGGLNFMNGQAGDHLPQRYNMGGGEGMVTYWLGRRLGVSGDFRFGAGTTPILPTGDQFGLHRVLVYQSIFSGGAEYRGPRNRYAAISLHALAGATRGTFDSAIAGYPSTRTPQPTDGYVGLYDNHTSPWGAIGGSIDFNASPKLAVRISPDMTFEHFGSNTREFVAVSGGIVYRWGKKR